VPTVTVTVLLFSDASLCYRASRHAFAVAASKRQQATKTTQRKKHPAGKTFLLSSQSFRAFPFTRQTLKRFKAPSSSYLLKFACWVIFGVRRLKWLFCAFL
jgi:hypothetical protein